MSNTTDNFVQATNVPKPCPSCGHCPTCGRRPNNGYPYYPWGSYPYITWGTNTAKPANINYRQAYNTNSVSCTC